jgi:hypothetical protein
MSDTFDHYGDAMNSYLDYQLEEDEFDQYSLYSHYPRQSNINSNKKDIDIWHYHGWYELVAFHQEFEKFILITLKLESNNNITVSVPKSIIGKMETTVTFNTNETKTRYLIHTKTLHKLSEVDVIYLKDNKEYTFMGVDKDGNYFMDRGNDYAISIPISELTYFKYENLG